MFKVDFTRNLPPMAPENLLDEFLTEFWLPDSLCDSAPGQNLLEIFSLSNAINIGEVLI